MNERAASQSTFFSATKKEGKRRARVKPLNPGRLGWLSFRNRCRHLTPAFIVKGCSLGPKALIIHAGNAVPDNNKGGPNMQKGTRLSNPYNAQCRGAGRHSMFAHLSSACSRIQTKGNITRLPPIHRARPRFWTAISRPMAVNRTQPLVIDGAFSLPRQRCSPVCAAAGGVDDTLPHQKTRANPVYGGPGKRVVATPCKTAVDHAPR